MDYYGLLFLYYLKGLSGKSVLKLFFNIEAGGTEQLLPENTSTPTTTPILADIQYPDGLRTDQYFTYRETPTTVSNKARIKTIKGNTLVWNQLFNSMETKTTDGITTSYDSTTHLVSITNGSRTSNYSSGSMRGNLNFNFIKGHKYFAKADKDVLGVVLCEVLGVYYPLNTIFTVGADVTPAFWRVTNQYDFVNTHPIGDVTSFYLNVFDLTQMGLDSITSVDEFTALFPLSYYAYNQGSLLSFMGNGIKTVSKNQFDTNVITTSYAGLTLTKTQGTIRAVYSGGSQYAGFNFYGSPVFTDTFLKGRYRLSFDVSGLDTQWTVGLRQGASFLGGGQALAFSNDGHYSFTIDTEANPNCYLSFSRTGNKTTAFDITFSNIQLELGTTETSYTPFEEKTISLPISTYFPTGMKSAGSVYDELTNSKAITRVGAVDLGTLTWGRNPTAIANRYRFYSDDLQNIAKAPTSNAETSNIICSTFSIVSYNTLYNSDIDKVITISSAGVISAVDSSYTDATAFKTAMSGVYLYYELATPTETPITTEDANEALSLLMGKSVSSSNANQLINIITKGE